MTGVDEDWNQPRGVSNDGYNPYGSWPGQEPQWSWATLKAIGLLILIGTVLIFILRA